MRLAVSGHTRILLTYILPVLLLSLLLNLPRILSLTPLGMEDGGGSCYNYVIIQNVSKKQIWSRKGEYKVQEEDLEIKRNIFKFNFSMLVTQDGE
jgi:hypothetical protein